MWSVDQCPIHTPVMSRFIFTKFKPNWNNSKCLLSDKRISFSMFVWYSVTSRFISTKFEPNRSQFSFYLTLTLEDLGQSHSWCSFPIPLVLFFLIEIKKIPILPGSLSTWMDDNPHKHLQTVYLHLPEDDLKSKHPPPSRTSNKTRGILPNVLIM